MTTPKFLSLESDAFVGSRKRIRRYLICSLQGYFPVLVKTGPRELACIFRVGGVHVSISATLAVSTSSDGGRSWSEPVNIEAQWEDCRNPAFGVNTRGELIAVFWKSILDRYEETTDGMVWSRENRLERRREPSLFSMKSLDNGKTWREHSRYGSEVLDFVSPYGRIITAPDGTLLMPAYGPRLHKVDGVRDTAVVLRSNDGGVSWGDETILGDKLNEYSLCYNAEGDLVAAARNEAGSVWILYSRDHGRAWEAPMQVTREGEHPADLTLLPSGRLLLTFGRRIRPFGCGALISADGGRTWNREREALLAGDGVRNTDLGYPSTVALDDGSIVTALYYASGSEGSDGPFHGWGDVSAQALVYSEDLFR